MARLLFLAYHYPPVGGGGVQRNRRFAEHLRSFGHEPVVVTGTGSQSARWTPLDATLADPALAGLSTHRVPGPEPAPGTGTARLVNGLLDRHDPLLRWWLEGAVAAGRTAGTGCDAILASLIPYETAQAAMRLSADLGIPWIADLQDPWALDEMWLYPTGLHHRIDRRRMRRQLASAAAIVMNTPEAADRLCREFPELRSRIVASITNGFDAADFATPVAPRTDGTFRIVHTGTMHTTTGLRLRARKRLRRALGGVTPHVDFLPRSHVYLLEALGRLREQDPSLTEGVEVHLAGVLTEADRRIADASPFARLLGYLSHEDTLALVRTADLLFLPMHDLAPGHRAGLVPGKAYEYIASGRPILAAVPDGDVRDILGAVRTARFCRPADVDAMARLLREAVLARRAGIPGPAPDPAAVAPYERRALTARLAGVIDDVLDTPARELPTAALPA
ncbi:glycosyltransferase family 4 protein [Baekduia soli]|uniref:Glycosyltransferase family 4 protein n=1 Tax=Baekduia soli TaxID=496014 RepID=A0A5B8UB85_9ACTN|nr:glycosyltransferase [Baekduia soli]QEC50088.1 glycosyltransferase family 4 protein [Baekduia soli]